MTFQPVGVGLDQRRPTAAPGNGDSVGDHRADRMDVVAVNHDRRQPVRRGLVSGRARGGDHRADRGVLHVLVVLADEQHRQLPDRREIDRLVERADVHRTVTEEADGDRIGLLDLAGPGQPARDRQVRTDNGVGAVVAVLHAGDVHRATLAGADPACLAQQFGEDRLRRGTAGEGMGVAAVGADRVVPWGQNRADTDGDRLLAEAEMRGTVHPALPVEDVDLLQKRSGEGHLLVQRELVVDIGERRCRGDLTQEFTSVQLVERTYDGVTARASSPRVQRRRFG